MAKTKKAKAIRTGKAPKKRGGKAVPVPSVANRRRALPMSDEMGPPIGDTTCVSLPAGPQTGKAYLIIEDGVIKWESA